MVSCAIHCFPDKWRELHACRFRKPLCTRMYHIEEKNSTQILIFETFLWIDARIIDVKGVYIEIPILSYS
jgi:hypothetical protein